MQEGYRGTPLECISYLARLKDGIYEVKPYHPKRSLSANALYWQMVTKMASSLRISNSYMHNQLLRRYGVIEEIDGQEVWIAVPDTAEAEKRADEDEIYHLKPTPKIYKSKRWYLLLKPSHEFNSAEMSRLIDGTASEMREMGLVPPMDEDIQRAIERMEKNDKVQTEQSSNEV